jgi:DNA-binding transcriptional MerR regulator
MTDDEDDTGARRNGKSEAAFRTISEVADELDVPQHVLRFWEGKIPQVKPLKRGGGRRYYRPDDVALLRRIRDLLYSEGYTIKGVQKLLKEGGARDGHAPAAAPSRAAERELALDLGDHDESESEPDGDDFEDDLAEHGAEHGADLHDDVHDGLAVDDHRAVVRAPVSAEVPTEVSATGGMSPQTRRELREILVELEQLRGLLRPR